MVYEYQRLNLFYDNDLYALIFEDFQGRSGLKKEIIACTCET